MAWSWVLVGSAAPTTDPIGEIHKAYDRKLNLPLNGLPTASVRLDLVDPLADAILSRDGDVLLKVYDSTNTIRFVGDLTTAEEVSRAEEGKPPSLMCNFAGPLWRLQKRICGKTDYTASPPNTDLTFSPTDRGVMLWSLIDTTNTEGGDTGIREGTVTATTYMSAGPWRYKPIAEAIAEVTAIPAYPFDSTTTYTRHDTFDDVVSATPLHGRTATGGGTWTSTAVSAVDYGSDSTQGIVYREVTTDADLFAGRYADFGASITGAVMYEAELKLTAGPYHGRFGILARSSAGNFVMAAIEPWANVPTYVTLYKDIGGTISTVGLSSGMYITDQYYWLRLVIDDDGNYVVWFWPAVSNPVPVMSGFDADLASTASPLGAGKVGIYDANDTNGSPAVQRWFNEVRAAVPTIALERKPSDFEFAPVEPVVDGSGTHIADFNISPQIGTIRTTVFEFGGGSRSMRSYRRVLDKAGMVNRAYSLDPTFPEGTDNRVGANTTAITARGWFEEVIPSDLADAGLRQALADQHATVRGNPRQLVTFEPSVGGPVFGTDYIVGDIVTGRATSGGTVRFNGLFRIYGIELTIDDEGKETLVPTLVPEA